MKVVCAWCRKHLSGDESDPVVSRGICIDCDKKLRDEESILPLFNAPELPRNSSSDLHFDVGGEG